MCWICNKLNGNCLHETVIMAGNYCGLPKTQTPTKRRNEVLTVGIYGAIEIITPIIAHFSLTVRCRAVLFGRWRFSAIKSHFLHSKSQIKWKKAVKESAFRRKGQHLNRCNLPRKKNGLNNRKYSVGMFSYAERARHSRKCQIICFCVQSTKLVDAVICWSRRTLTSGK